MSANTLHAGFVDPVSASQAGFRAVLDAMAHPGRVYPLKGPAEVPSGLGRVTAGVLLTLADYSTPLWIDPAIAGQEGIQTYLRFHTGAPMVDVPKYSEFALIGKGEAPLNGDRFSIGTPDYPDRATTLILQVDGFERGDAVVLTGPGIETPHRFAPAPLPAGFWDVVRNNAALFPLGLDIILCGPDSVAALPRSTRIGG